MSVPFNTIITAYVSNKNVITAVKKQLLELNKVKNELEQEIIKHLTYIGKDGLRIDKNTVVKMDTVTKTRRVAKNKYKEKIKDLLLSKGRYIDELENEIIDAKINKTTPTTRLTIKSEKL